MLDATVEEENNVAFQEVKSMTNSMILFSLGGAILASLVGVSIFVIRKKRALVVINLPNIGAEYLYVGHLTCKKCGSKVESNRLGSVEGKESRMNDIWRLDCRRCGHSWEIILAVPRMSLDDFEEMLKASKSQNGPE